MAIFPSFKLTKKGEELLNRCIGEGKVLTFTKFKIGSGEPAQDWRDLSDIQTSFKTFPVLETSVQKNGILRIKGYFDNKGFTEDKKFKEIGVFVSLEGVDGEFLYSYTNAGDTGDIIPAESGGFFSRTLDVSNYIGYATNITFNIEQARDYYDFNTEAEVKVATFLKKGDKIRLWGRLALGDIDIINYIVSDTATSFALDNGLYCELAGNAVVADVENGLKNLKGAKIGDIIEVLGYYEKGDGAGHKRKVESADDGSGVQLANGLWANVVHSGEVNVNWFGAKGDGIKDDTESIQKALSSEAQTINFNTGKFLVTNTLNVRGARKTLKGFGIGSSPYKYVHNKIITNESNTNPILNVNGVGTSGYRNGLLIDGIHIEGNNKCDGIYFEGVTSNLSMINCSVGLCKKALVFDNTLISHFSNLDISTNETAIYFKSDYFNNVSFRDCRIYNNKKVIEQESYAKQFGHGVLFDCCEIEANGYDDYTGNCMEISLGTSSSDSFGIKFSNCWIEGNKGEYILKINAIGETHSTVILDDNVIFGLNTRTINLAGTNNRVKIVAKNTSNISNTNFGSLTISNGSINTFMNCAFSSKNLTNNSYVNEIGSMSNDGYNTFLKGIDIISNTGGQPTTIRKRASNANSLEFTTASDFYFNCKNFYINGVPKSGIMTLDTPYYTTKMQQEGVYEDFISYMDAKLEYDDQQRELETQRQQAFEESGIENYEEWLATQPMALALDAEPVPSDKLLAFKIKYLGE